MQQNSLWKLALLIIILGALAAIGVGCLISPDWGIKHFGRSLRKGGELQTEWNRLGISFAGLAFGGGALYLLYVLLRDYLAHR